MALVIQADKIKNPSLKPTKPFAKHIFRAYDIRGLVDDELSVELYYNVGRGLGAVMREKKKKVILLGFDARLSSYEFASSLSDGLQDSGIDVISVGLVPSPVLYFAFGNLDCNSGVMVTGSHNPKEYNGIKMVVDGENLTSSDIEDLYFRINEKRFYDGNATYREIDVIPSYIQTIKDQIQLQRPLKVVIDCGNGVAGALAGNLFRGIGAQVTELYCDVDGNFPNHHPDPSIPENMNCLSELVQSQKFDIGLAFDGDADRLGVVTSKGEIIWPDRQLICLAQSILKSNPGAAVVYDVKCSSLLEEAINNAGGKAIMSPTGHSVVKKAMRDNNALLAGEMSGHIFIKDNWSGFDDALYSAARLLEILAKSPLRVEEQFALIPDSINTQELKVHVNEQQKFKLMSRIVDTWFFDEGRCLYIDGLRWQSNRGWGLVRASNTSPYLILRFEADNQEDLIYIQNLFKARFKALDPTLRLPF